MDNTELQESTVFIAQTLAYLGEQGNLDVMVNGDPGELIAELKKKVNEHTISKEKMGKYYDVAQTLVQSIMFALKVDSISIEDLPSG